MKFPAAHARRRRASEGSRMRYLFLFVLAACGGSRAQASKTEAAADAPSKSESAPEPSGKPRWVTRGSVAVAGDKRAFYGVGSASGIKEAALLRSTADNRARAELAKLLDTFSASLMKD